jgi:hypothetical protein
MAAFGAKEFVDSIAFPLGFLFSTADIRWVPAGYFCPFPDLSLFVHLRTRLASCRSRDGDVVLIGLAVDPEHPQTTESAIAEALHAALASGETAFFELVGRIVGRYAVLFRFGGGSWRVLNDATGLRSVYYAAENAAAVASSHAYLTARQTAPRDLYPRPRTKWGFPGAYTPYPGVFLLTPNNYLDLGPDLRTTRFYPKAAIPRGTADEAAAECIRVGQCVIRGLLARGPVAVSISSGIDSRVTLALALEFGRRIRYFTYLFSPANRVDVAAGENFAKDFGLDHVTLGPDHQRPFLGAGELSARFQQQLALNSFGSHGTGLIPRYRNCFGQWQHVHIRSNVYEIGRASFQEKKGHLPPPSSIESMISYYKNWNVFKTADATFVREAFEDYFTRAHSAEALAHIDAHDVYFWEHRMPAWQSNVILESDCVWETAVILNSRNMLDRFVAIPPAERIENQVYDEVLRRTEPRLLIYPFNPTEWPK